MSKRILIVGESASVRRVESFVLSSAGYQVIEAMDGDDALARLAGQRVHLILTGLDMPHRDGVDLIRAVREHSAHRLTPVVMITTPSQEPRKQDGRAAGATGWIAKPFTPDQLLTVVRRVIGA